MKAHINFLLAALAACCSGLALAQAPAAATYPERRVTLVVAAATGGGLDAAARLIAKRMQEQWGQAVIIENQGGAEGLIATRRVADATPDGYTLLLQIPSMLLLKHTAASKEAAIDASRAFVPITEIGRTPSAISVNSRIGVSSIKELAAYCARPAMACSWGYGQQLSYLYGRRSFALAGVRSATSVPYKGTGPVINDLLGGHITIGITSIAAPLPQYQSGALKILAVNAERRLPQAPEVPTFREAGIDVPPRGSWYGLFAPRGTPADVIARIEATLMPLARDPAAAAAVRLMGAEPVFGSSKEFSAGVREEEVFLEQLLQQYPLAGQH